MEKDKILGTIKEYIEANNLNNREIADFITNLRIDIMQDKYKDQQGLFVLKNKGIVEKYDSEKLYNSLASVSDESKVNMNSADINIIIKDVEKNIKEANRNIIPAWDLREYVTNALKKHNYEKVEKCYNS